MRLADIIKGWSIALATAALGGSAHAAAHRGADTILRSLAEFESGARTDKQCRADFARGRHGEVSRYQILPREWRAVTRSSDYANPELSMAVARCILRKRIKEMNRPFVSPVNLYILWNAPAQAHGHKKLSKTVFRRALRFSKLITMNTPAFSDAVRRF